jgi:hypothetical protein
VAFELPPDPLLPCPVVPLLSLLEQAAVSSKTEAQTSVRFRVDMLTISPKVGRASNKYGTFRARRAACTMRYGKNRLPLAPKYYPLPSMSWRRPPRRDPHHVDEYLKRDGMTTLPIKLDFSVIIAPDPPFSGQK